MSGTIDGDQFDPNVPTKSDDENASFNWTPEALIKNLHEYVPAWIENYAIDKELPFRIKDYTTAKYLPFPASLIADLTTETTPQYAGILKEVVNLKAAEIFQVWSMVYQDINLHFIGLSNNLREARKKHDRTWNRVHDREDHHAWEEAAEIASGLDEGYERLLREKVILERVRNKDYGHRMLTAKPPFFPLFILWADAYLSEKSKSHWINMRTSFECSTPPPSEDPYDEKFNADLLAAIRVGFKSLPPYHISGNWDKAALTGRAEECFRAAVHFTEATTGRKRNVTSATRKTFEHWGVEISLDALRQRFRYRK